MGDLLYKEEAYAIIGACMKVDTVILNLFQDPRISKFKKNKI